MWRSSLRVELGVVLAELEGRRQDADLLALDQLLEPPVGVVLGAEALDRLARAGQVVEVAALHRLLDLEVDPLVLALHPLGRGGAAGALVALRRPVWGSGSLMPGISEVPMRHSREQARTGGRIRSGARRLFRVFAASTAVSLAYGGRARHEQEPESGEEGGGCADRPDDEVAVQRGVTPDGVLDRAGARQRDREDRRGDGATDGLGGVGHAGGERRCGRPVRPRRRWPAAPRRARRSRRPRSPC